MIGPALATSAAHHSPIAIRTTSTTIRLGRPQNHADRPKRRLTTRIVDALSGERYGPRPCKRKADSSEHHEVSVQPDALQASDPIDWIGREEAHQCGLISE